MRTSIVARHDRAANPDVRRRVQDFKLFKEIAARDLANPFGGRAHDRMAQRNGYYLSTGRSARTAFPGRDRVELFYGSRAISGSDGATAEQGAILSFVQGVDGQVSVYLQPAETDGMRTREDALLVDRFTETARLTGMGYINRRWRDFRAYAEATSIDGEPGWRDRAKASWLRFTKPPLVDGRFGPSEMRRMAPQVMAVALAFLTGAVFF